MAAETKSIRTEIASFQTRVLGLEQRVSKVEAHASSFQDKDQELLFLCRKLTDMEHRSRRDNVRFIGFPENMEGEDLHRFLRDTLPRLTGTTFEPPLEFQRAHRLGPRRTGTDARPRPIIACLLCHSKARQLIQKAHTHSPFQLDGHTIRMSADFSKETSDRHRAFLALRPRLHQLEVKYGLFEPARIQAKPYLIMTRPNRGGAWHREHGKLVSRDDGGPRCAPVPGRLALPPLGLV
ncbi:hypothetical protein NDU88_009431 [Pleurodeles waltl]|uniref:Uncharacterized protein n=1 Tax=Pleurodeles waltl TaxID=8319 RepID=A0AAV7RXL2_PLEWA|nr:hypothetical protein NDU88_009431 [Pleurodeles waltl]